MTVTDKKPVQGAPKKPAQGAAKKPTLGAPKKPTQDAAKKPTQGASSEVVRDINRRIVLNLVRTRQPISRADLARVSGLQRSTISLIVEQLIDSQWVREGATGRLPRGRRPTFLRLNDHRRARLGNPRRERRAR